MGKEDVEAFDKLLARGIKFDVRKVPADSPENFDNMMKKAKAELGM
jgi:PTS system mannose-specific IIB component